jgi:class 3 adenylate cyclase
VSELPSGTVTFLFSDIEGSTRLMKELGDAWPETLAAHNRLVREAIADAGGREVDRQGDAFFAVFPQARNAVAAAITAQRSLGEHDWPHGARLRVRMGIHTGEPTLADEGYLGLDVVRAARICSIANGGQVLVSETTKALVRGDLGELSLVDAGAHALKDLDEPEHVYRLTGPGLHSAELALREPSGAEPMGISGREMDLARQAIQELNLGPLAALGPQIERQVNAALARAQPEHRADVARQLGRGLKRLEAMERRRDRLESRRSSPEGGWWVAAVVASSLLFLLGVTALIVWLIVSLAG